MATLVVVGGQWGDEGKGKIVDLLSSDADDVVRAQGGANAGHTVVVEGAEYKLHLIPSGIVHGRPKCYLASGVVLDPKILLQEIAQLEAAGVDVRPRLCVSARAHLVMPYHQLLDQLMERRQGSQRIGTTGRGIGPCYADKALRLGIRAGDLLKRGGFEQRLREVLALKNSELTQVFQAAPLDFSSIYDEFCGYAEQLAPLIIDVEERVLERSREGSRIVLEGAQGTFLDTNFGTYPFVTSSATCAAGICLGAGLAPQDVHCTVMVVKAYCTRVGQGPFPTEDASVSSMDHAAIREVGTTTGRKRRLGWFDAFLARRAAQLNGANYLAVTKLDILDSLDQIKIGVGYRLDGEVFATLPWDSEDLAKVEPIYETLPGWGTSTVDVTQYDALPSNAKRYLERLEELCQTPIHMISVGPDRSQTLAISPLFVHKERP